LVGFFKALTLFIRKQKLFTECNVQQLIEFTAHKVPGNPFYILVMEPYKNACLFSTKMIAI